jgi:hypothetical protein
VIATMNVSDDQINNNFLSSVSYYVKYQFMSALFDVVLEDSSFSLLERNMPHHSTGPYLIVRHLSSALYLVSLVVARCARCRMRPFHQDRQDRSTRTAAPTQKATNKCRAKEGVQPQDGITQCSEVDDQAALYQNHAFKSRTQLVNSNDRTTSAPAWNLLPRTRV